MGAIGALLVLASTRYDVCGNPTTAPHGAAGVRPSSSVAWRSFHISEQLAGQLMSSHYLDYLDSERESTGLSSNQQSTT
jgi:hypothetical protein